MSPAPFSVGRVRVQDVRRDPLATRVAVDRLLATAALRPRGLPPAAILVVRTLRDPLPRRLRLDRAGIRPPPEWEQAVAASLDDLARGAARPAHEAVAANAAAVLFADRAELLACLLADWAAGAIASRWWWRLVVRGSPTAAVPAELRASPTYVPASFSALAERGMAVAVAASIPPDEAEAIARSVAAAFGVRVAHIEGTRAEEQPTEPVAPGVLAERLLPERNPPPTPSAESTLAAELLPSVPEVRAPGLRAEQRTLLALALGLRRAPAVLRMPAEPALKEPPFAAPPARAPRTPVTAEAPRPSGGNSQSPTPGSWPAEARSAARPTIGIEPTTEAPSVTAPAHAPETAPPSRAAVAPTPQQRASPRAGGIAPPPTADLAPAAPRAAHPDTYGSPLFGPAVETRLGGLFFLVNVGIDLGLYGDFTQPARPGIALDLWDFVTLTGRQLLSGADDDPVWRLLAELAGRDPEDPPGAGFVPPAGETLAEWTAGRADEIRAVLAASELTPQRLVRRPAAVHVTDAHVDVIFALAGHPLKIRIAGLDRDPGFVPAAGRHVAFHFE